MDKPIVLMEGDVWPMGEKGELRFGGSWVGCYKCQRLAIVICATSPSQDKQALCDRGWVRKALDYWFCPDCAKAIKVKNNG